jgi:hypothetical protein
LNVTEYTNTGLTLGTDYTYRVKAFTAANESDYATSSATSTSFPAPTNLTATPLNDSEIQLTWSDNCSFESGYRLERSDGGSYAQIAELGENITEYTDTGLNYGTDYTYTYRVKAFTDENESGPIETTVNFWQDCNGVWGGSAVEDCNGDCDGTAFENVCGCVGGNTGLEEEFCYGCTNPDGYNYDPDATFDDGSCIIITITLPNGGETWEPGFTNTITWTSENLSSSYVGIRLYRNDSYYQTIESQVNNDGNYDWSIPSGFLESDNYKIRISEYNNSSVYDESNGYFTIDAISCWYKIALYDTGHNGWGSGSWSNYVNVYVDGSLYDSFNMSSYGIGPDVYEFPVNNGSTVYTTFTSMGYPWECYYYIYDSDWNFVVSDGTNKQTPSGVSFTASCSR